MPLRYRNFEPLMDCEAVAIVGIACRFPGAPDQHVFWQRLTAGEECIREFTLEEVLAAGETPEVATHAAYVKSRGQLDDALAFDPTFFGYSPHEAALLDPQQRLFLQEAWHAFEDAAIVPGTAPKKIGVYAGAAFNTYLINRLAADPSITSRLDPWHIGIANDKDTLTSRVAYKLNLSGPAVTVQTACSSSLAAVHLACQALLNLECDVALAGGSTVRFPQNRGYVWRPEGIEARDGHCRAFARDATGTVFSDGVGVIALKRCEDAIANGDRIYAVIRGTAINNDGADKVGYSAPSMRGQIAVITDALAVAAVSADDVSYVEGHGTGTSVGDAIEISALKEVFAGRSARFGQCLLGSVKSNIGHTDNAAGVAGLIKTALALYHERLPRSVHCDPPNPLLDEGSPVTPCRGGITWRRSERARIALVSSFGIGGTNVSAVLQEAPPALERVPRSRSHIIPLSAASAASLDASSERLAAFLKETDQPLIDIAHTYANGRKQLAFRQYWIAAQEAGGARVLHRSSTAQSSGATTELIWWFPANVDGLATTVRELYNSDASFAACFDRCLERFDGILRHDVTSALQTDTRVIDRELLLLVFQLCLAERYRDLGLKPTLLVGQGIGHLTAAVVADVIQPEAALRIVDTWRGQGTFPAIRLGRASCLLQSAAGDNELSADELLDPEYWRALLQAPTIPARLLNLGSRSTPLLQEIGVRCTSSEQIATRSGQPLTLVRGIETGALGLPGWLRTVGELWLAGLSIAWEKLDGDAGLVTSVPGYSFQKTHCDLLHLSGAQKIPPPQGRAVARLYRRTWAREYRRREPSDFSGRQFIVIGRRDCATQLSDAIAQRGGLARCLIHATSTGTEEAGWRQAIEALDIRAGSTLHVIFIVGAGDSGIDCARNSLHRVQTLLMHPVSSSAALMFHWVVSQAFAIADDPVDPDKRLLWGIARVLPQEHPEVISRFYDLRLDAHGDAAIQQLLRGLELEPTAERFGAYVIRNGHRWLPRFELIERLPHVTSPAVLRTGGTYIITGGAGGIGRILAKHLVDKWQANVVVCGRRPRHEIANDLLHLGSSVAYQQADVTRQDQLLRVFEIANEHYGAIHGVFHCAGEPGRAVILQRDAAWNLLNSDAKIAGTRALCAVLETQAVDFLVQFGSVRGWFGGVGASDYCAANAFMDAVAESGGTRHRVLSIAWDTWQGIGMAAQAEERLRQRLANLQEDTHVHELIEAEAGGSTLTVQFAARHWLRREHKINGISYLPATAQLALLFDFLRHTQRGGTQSIQRIQLLTPFNFEHDDTLILKRQAAHVEQICVLDLRGQVLVTAEVTSTPPEGVTATATRVPSEYLEGPSSVVLLQLPPQLAIGPRWRCVAEVCRFETSMIRVALAVPDIVRQDLSQWPLHPAIVDAALVPLQLWSSEFAVPAAFDEVIAFDDVASAAYSFVHITSAQRGAVVADVWITDRQQRVLLFLGGVTFLARVPAESATALTSSSTDLTSAAPAGGLGQNDALQALEFLLNATDLDQSIVTAGDIEELEAAARSSLATAGSLIRGVAADVGESSVMSARKPQQRDAAETLRSILQQCLGFDEIDVTQSFSELGGDSLIGLQVVSEAKDAGISLSLAMLYRASSLAEIIARATQIETKAPPVQPERPLPFLMVSAEDRAQLSAQFEDAFPLSKLQEGICFYKAMYEDTDIYRDFLWIRISGVCNVELLNQSIAACARRHATLRTSIVTTGSMPLNAVRSNVDLACELHDLGPEEQVRTWIEAEKRRGAGSLGRAVRFIVLRRPDEFSLVLFVDDALLDGWSTALLLGEVIAVYDGLLGGAVVSQPVELKSSFRDYVAHERRILDQGLHKAFWQQQLQGCEPFSVARCVGHRTSAAAHAAIQVSIRQVVSLPSADVDRLTGRFGASAKVIFLACYLRALQLWSGERQVIVGVETHTRMESAQSDSVLGLHLNMLPLRYLGAETAPEQVVSEVQHSEAALFENRYLPLSEIQRGFAQPLFDACYNFTHFHVLRATPLSRVRVLEHYGEEKTHYAFKLWVNRAVVEDDRFDVYLIFDMERLPSAEVAVFERIFCGLLRDWQSREADVPRSNALPAQVDTVGTQLDAKAVPRAIFQHFESACAARPGNTALIVGTRSYTFETLNTAANRLARYFQSQGVTCCHRVAIHIHRGFDWVAATLAVLKAGATIVFLDPTAPLSRKLEIARATGAHCIVTLEPFAPGETARALPKVLQIESGREVIEQYSGANLDIEIPALLPAYLILTSASTGAAKIVEGTHAGLSNRFDWHSAVYPFTNGDIALARTASSFVDAIWELLGPLASGVPLVLVEDRSLVEVDTIADLLIEHRITHLVIVPSLLRELLRYFRRRGDTERISLRLVSVSGEMLARELMLEARALLPQVRWINLYGSAEVSADVACYDLHSSTLWRTSAVQSVPAGYPIAKTRLHVLDERMRPVEEGAEGELYIGGPALANGYCDSPALTAERFVPNPWAEHTWESRLYRSGDRARVVQGMIEILGRVDRQVKVRGVRVDLDAIELKLAEIPGVAHAAAILTNGSLDCYLEYSADVESRALMAEVRRMLPVAERPSTIYRVEQLPRTAGGKLERGRLSGSGTRVVLSESAKKPATATELRLEKLWNRLLPGVDVRSDSRFDEAGGDSLATMRLSHLIEREFGKRVRIRTLIQLPTFESQVSWLEKETLSALPAVSEPLTSQQGIETSAFELTDLQQSYWVARQIRSPDSSHNTHLYCELEVAHLNVERLNRAWNALIVHHEALRTIVLPSGLQQVLPPRPYQIVEIDWSLLDDRSRAARLDEHRRRVSHECFDLHCWPLFSVHAIKISAAISILTVSIDLLIVDAWSLQILERQLASLYHQPDYVLPRAEITLATVIRYFHARVGGDAYARSRKYWLSRVAGFPPAPQLPMRRSQPAAYRVSRREIRVGAEDCNSLSRLAERMKLSRTSLMLAIFVTILERWSAASAFSIALTVLDRPLLHEDIDNLLGNFTSMIPLGVDVKPAEGFMALWRQVHQQLLDDLDHMEYSGVKFLRELRREPGVEPPRMSYVFTRITGGGGRVEKTPTLGRERFRITQTSDVWIDNQVVDTDDGSMRLHWDACDEVFEAGVVDAMFEAYGEAVRAVVMAAGCRQSEIELNDNVGRELPLSQRRKRKSACMTAAHDINYLERIQHAAADFPQNLAVISADREITHRQLWHEATQLADQLREVTQPDECIGLHMSPGWQQVVAILATQISGRTYVPLSWQWPSAKVNGIVGEFRIRTVLTEDLAVSSRSQPSAAMSVADDANPLAYIMFTSGSTGQPKGVMMRRHAVGNTLADLVARLHLGPADRILALADISFDLSVFDILGALMVGAAIVIPGPEANRNPKLWWEWCHSQRVSIWNSVPAYMDLLMHYAQDKPQLPPLQLRWILLSGDWIDLQLPARLADKFPQARILSLGGATEAGIWSVAFPITQIEPDWRSIPYGMPLTNQDCGVVDDFERECPDWVVGELRIYGNSLSEGYLNAPQLTERQFRVEPRSGRRCYLTGDLARYRPDGVLELIGRKDAQVKIAGNRIECGEIEHVIRRCAGVTGAVVIPLDEDHGVIKLHAVLALANEGTIAQVKEHCRASLPSPVLPSYWHTDIAISLSDTGKVNKRLLKERIAQKLSQGLEV